MTNVSGTPEKMAIRRALRKTAEGALRAKGYSVERVTGGGKSSLRRITKDGSSKIVTIRTTQDCWIAFPRNKKNNGWKTLEEVDFVIAASVDNRDKPHFAKIHMIPGDEMRERFDRAYEARKAAGYTLPRGRGVWVSLYEQEANDPVNRVGAGAGLKHRPIAELPLILERAGENDEDDEDGDIEQDGAASSEPPLTIAEAKRRLALSLGVNVDDIKITISS
jgi:hypothetical protein